MYINKFLDFVQNSKTGNFLADSLVFEKIDTISFILLIAVIISTAFMPSDIIGFLAVAFVFSCLFKLLSKKGERINVNFENKIFIIYLLIVLISALGASCFALSMKGLLKTAVYAAFYFSAVYFLSSAAPKKNIQRIGILFFVIASLVCFESVVGIMQNLSHVEAIATWQDMSAVKDPTAVISRAYGTLKPYNPNLLAGYLIAGLSSVFAFVMLSLSKNNKKGFLLALFLFFVCIYAIFVTGCRGAYLGLFGFFALIFCLVIYFLKKKFGTFGQIKTKYKALIALVPCSVFAIICLIPSFSSRIASIFSMRKDSSISFRINVYEACAQMFSDNKFLGIGVGNKNFREIYGLYMKTGFDALGSYSVPLEIAVESGIFALIAFISFILVIVFKSLKYIKNFDSVLNPNVILLSAILLTITGTMFHGFFDTIFFRPQVQILFWINIAIYQSCIAIQKEHNCSFVR